jgi:RNA polymerase sigma-70 factor (ECF subfamily)
MRSDFAGLVPDIAAAGRAPKAQHNDTSDAALIAKVAAGNRLAMQVLFARHHARVYRFILRLLGSEAAEDLTSEVFLGVWRHAHRFEARSSVTTWLLAIARYKALAELRRRPQLACEEAAAQTSDPADDPEATFAIKHRGEIVRDCLGRLSRRHREVIDLVYYHGKSVQEAAAILGIPGNTVKTRMFHARKNLSELLAARGVMGALA